MDTDPRPVTDPRPITTMNPHTHLKPQMSEHMGAHMIVEEPHAVVYPVAAARGGAPMLPRLSVRWLIPLTLVVLLLAGCGQAVYDVLDGLVGA